MKKASLVLLAAAMSALNALAYDVGTYPGFWLDDTYQTTAGWVSISKYGSSNTLASLGDSIEFHVALNESGIVVAAWGEGPAGYPGGGPTLNINNIDWKKFDTSTNYTCSYDSSYEVDQIYVGVKVRYMQYSLAFDSNGGAPVSPQEDICYTNSVILPAVVRAGYTFDGWTNAYNTTALTGTVLNAGQVLGVNDDGTNITMFAKWTAVFEVKFFDFDGETPLLVEQVKEGGSVEPPSPLKHEGRMFVGWSSSDYENVTSNMTILAQYAADTYTVVYDPNGGSGGPMTNDTVTYWTEFNLQSNSYTRSVHEFLGWSTNPNAATNEIDFGDGAMVSNLTPVANGTSKLYAVWGSMLSEYSIAADCNNLILGDDGVRSMWSIDYSKGFASTSSVYTAANSGMQALLPECGTLVFRARATIENSSKVTFDSKFTSDDSLDIPSGYIEDTIIDWRVFICEKVNEAESLMSWRFNAKENDECWIDQIHWYPGKFASFDDLSGMLYDKDLKDEAREAILAHWDEVLAVATAGDAQNVTTIVATGDSATNAPALLDLGVPPTSVEIYGNVATAKFENVSLPTNIAPVEVVVDFSDAPYAYTGSAITPTVTSVKLDSLTLDENTHYSVSYLNNTNAGVATIIVKGLPDGGYGGTYTTNFTIGKAAYDMSGAAWNYSDAFIYDGSAKSVSVTGLPSGVTAVYTGNTAIWPGTNTASVTLYIDDTENYNQPDPIPNLEWVINANDQGGGGDSGGGDSGGDSGGGGGDDPASDDIAGTCNVEFKKAQTMTGALYDAAGNLAGTVQVKAAKISSKGSVKFTATATLLTGKKLTAKATLPLGADGTMEGTFTFKAPIAAMSFSMAANGDFTLKNANYEMADRTIGGKLTKGAMDFLAEMAPLPEVAAGYEIIEGLLPTNVTLAITGGKKMNAGKAASIKYKKFKVDGQTWYDLVGFDDPKKPNLSALKLTYTPSTGIFKGSFKMYATNEGIVADGKKPTLKTYTMSVMGLILDDGQGQYGVGEITGKKLTGSWSVEIK